MKSAMKAISAALLALLVGCSAQEPEVSRDTAPESVAETVSDHLAISRIAFGSEHQIRLVIGPVVKLPWKGRQ